MNVSALRLVEILRAWSTGSRCMFECTFATPVWTDVTTTTTGSFTPEKHKANLEWGFSFCSSSNSTLQRLDEPMQHKTEIERTMAKKRVISLIGAGCSYFGLLSSPSFSCFLVLGMYDFVHKRQVTDKGDTRQQVRLIHVQREQQQKVGCLKKCFFCFFILFAMFSSWPLQNGFALFPVQDTIIKAKKLLMAKGVAIAVHGEISRQIRLLAHHHTDEFLNEHEKRRREETRESQNECGDRERRQIHEEYTGVVNQQRVSFVIQCLFPRCESCSNRK